jgi:hypothetical protein
MNSTWKTSCLFLACIFFAVGCGGDTATEGLKISAAFDVNPDVELKRVATLGKGESGVLFGKPVDAAIGADGRLFVLDRAYSKVHVFSPEGEHVQEIGRRGRGPGEFQKPTSIEIGPHDSLFVSAGQADRVSVFGPGPDRSFQYAYSVESKAVRTPGAVYPTSSGGAFALYSTPYGPAPGTPGKWLARINARGKIVDDSVAHRPLIDAIVSEPEPGRVRTVIRPFARRSIFEAHPTGAVCHAWTGDPTIECIQHSNDRDTNKRDTLLTLPHTPIPVRDDDVDAVRQTRSETSMQTIREHGVHDTYPVFGGMAIGRDGRVWIRSVARKSVRKQNVTYYGINPEGETAVAVTLPKEDRIVAATDHYVYATRFPARPEIVVYEIVGT